ncbi:MAG TPA: DUF1778 domain-containing protein [Rhizomicrobium sp.]|jgi:uncharacterized protein (DUF1778 family)
MSQAAARRTQRIEARISPAALSIVRRAAEIQGRSISDFVVAAAQEVAERTVEKTQMIQVALADYDRIMDVLSKPPKITPAWKRAVKAHRRLIQSDR